MPVGPILGQQVDGVSAVIGIHFHVPDHGNLPSRPVHEHSLALTAHLNEVSLEEPAVLGVDDEDHPPLLTSCVRSMRKWAELRNTPDQGYWGSAIWHAACRRSLER